MHIKNKKYNFINKIKLLSKKNNKLLSMAVLGGWEKL
jgi:hypothetical protein